MTHSQLVGSHNRVWPVICSLEPMQPTFEQLLQVIRTLAESTDIDFVRIVLASSQDVRFIEVTDNPELRTELQEAFQEGFLALGLLGWEVADEKVQTKAILFPWHQENETLCGLFDRLSEEAADSVREEFERRCVN